MSGQVSFSVDDTVWQFFLKSVLYSKKKNYFSNWILIGKSKLLNVLLLVYIQGLRFAFGYLPRVPSTMQMCTQSERTKQMELNLRAKVKMFFQKWKFKNVFLIKKWWAYWVYTRTSIKKSVVYIRKKMGWLSSFTISLWCLKA